MLGHREEADMLCVVDKAYADSSSRWPRILTCIWETCNYIDENTVVDIPLPDYGGCFTILYIQQIWIKDQAVIVAIASSEEISVHTPILKGDPLLPTCDPSIRRRGVSSPLSTFQIDDYSKIQVVMEHLKSIGSLSVQCSVITSHPSLPPIHLNRLRCWIHSDELSSLLTIEVDICKPRSSSNCVMFQIKLPDKFVFSESIEARGSLYSDMPLIVLRLPYPPSPSVQPLSAENTVPEITGDFCCGFCLHTIALGESIHNIRSMPLGLLDHVSRNILFFQSPVIFIMMIASLCMSLSVLNAQPLLWLVLICSALRGNVG